ncbi:type II CRISPR-associated endonuclease Cas1 [Fluviicola sp.]|jgi:CRISPR-associated protein Cas1|uniref:type II CRISPR-associated endonuclease Cas1 n=1 Tax=Fluviicola sp. TaxID=1917219 RepID=UPI00283A7ACA|nr:type II CRISPR-associated endonuclease Cas1 [Fluviicola sp.]MDR0801803.1 type II CRISPR-associated endonuclease Cas1 [Fluviicola sp.]
MVKRTIHISNPAHLYTRNEQLVLELKDDDRTTKILPIEDLGVVILEHPQITFTANLLEKLMNEKVAVITCNSKYMPSGMFLPLEGNSEQTERIRTQLEASLPLKKQLWQQTVRSKILNQALVLRKLDLPDARLLRLQNDVLSGDSSNCEAQAASHYWGQLYGKEFTRTQDKNTPNAQLNYGYAILRSIVARALTSSGMFPSVGIHHRNKYNAFCLADDIMEPYRPFIDWHVLQLPDLHDSEEGLTREQKTELLKLPQIDVLIGEVKRPLFHAVSITTASLYRCFEGTQRKITYPEFE